MNATSAAAGRTKAGAVPVRVDRVGDVACVTLARGDTGNGFDLELATSLRDAVLQLADWAAGTPGRDGIGAVLLRAEGSHFSVGGDLRAFVSRGAEVGPYVRAVADAAHGAVLGLVSLPVPVIAEVHGAVAGGGVGLMLSADLVIAARSAKVRLAYTALGLSPDCGASWFLPRMVGEQRALDLMLTNRVLGAAEAEQWGLVSRVAAEAELPSVADAVARSLATGHRGAHSRVKHLVRARSRAGLRDHLESEAASIAEAAARLEVRVAMEQFLTRPRSQRA